MLIAALVAVVGIVAVSNVGTQAADKLNTVSNLLEESGTGVEPANWDYTNYLCFTANIPDSTVAMEAVGVDAPEVTLEYSFDKVSWEPFIVKTSTAAGTIVKLENVGDHVFLRGDNWAMGGGTKPWSGNNHYNGFVLTGSISASGSIMTLLDKTDALRNLTGRDIVFKSLFRYCSALTSAPEFPATLLSSYCYWSCFYECTSLSVLPNNMLPADVAVNNCYQYMFYGCSSLADAPYLPATTLEGRCYNGIFKSCPLIKSVKIGYTGSFNSEEMYTPFWNWLENTNPTGTLYYNGSDTTIGANAIPSGWVVNRF